MTTLFSFARVVAFASVAAAATLCVCLQAQGPAPAAERPRLPASLPSAVADSSAPGANARRVLDRYCVTCHNERLKTADLRLDRLDVSNIAADAEAWEKVVRKVHT